MALSKTKRRAYVCEGHLTTYHNSFPAPSMRELLDAVREKFEKDEIPPHVLDNGKRIYRLRAIEEVGDDCVCLLIGMSNDDIPDGANEDKSTGKVRLLSRLGNESPALSAHVLIRLNPNPRNNITYATLVEKVTGLGLESIRRFLRHVFTETCDERRLQPETNKLKWYKVMIELQGHKSTTISNELSNGGKLSGIRFSNTELTSDGLGEEAYPVVTTRSVELKLQNKPTGEAAKEWLKKVIGRSKDEYEEARIMIVPEGANQKTSPLDMELEDVLSGYFIKDEEFGDFDTDLNTCEEKIRRDLVDRMKLKMPDNEIH